MTDNRSIFFNEWQACLRAHYTHVIRAHDVTTEPTLRGVLRQTGLTDTDLDDLRDRAEAQGPAAQNSVADEVPEPVSEAT